MNDILKSINDLISACDSNSESLRVISTLILSQDNKIKELESKVKRLQSILDELDSDSHN